MKTVDRFINKTEEIVFKELSAVAADNGLRAFPKTRLADVLRTDGTRLVKRVFDYYTRSHFDFLVTGCDYRPYMAIEYDGPFHSNLAQVERDQIKNSLCERAAFPILRIKANHVFRKFRGMTLLRWLIEVSQMQIAFDEAQQAGHVPCDEPFDPAMVMSDGSGRKWPYWLSLDANIRINRFLHTKPGTKAWVSMRGEDDENIHGFEYLRVGDEFMFVKTAARDQGAALPIFEMVGEITRCEMDEHLARHLEGAQQLLSLKEFKPIHDRICRRYNMRPNTSMGSGL